jgi:hypothetical protein
VAAENLRNSGDPGITAEFATLVVKAYASILKVKEV